MAPTINSELSHLTKTLTSCTKGKSLIMFQAVRAWSHPEERMLGWNKARLTTEVKKNCCKLEVWIYRSFLSAKGFLVGCLSGWLGRADARRNPIPPRREVLAERIGSETERIGRMSVFAQLHKHGKPGETSGKGTKALLLREEDDFAWFLLGTYFISWNLLEMEGGHSVMGHPSLTDCAADLAMWPLVEKVTFDLVPLVMTDCARLFVSWVTPYLS